MQSRYYIYMVFLCALFFVCGYKIGDASGYRDGYEYGYRFDCKEEIGDLYKQVKNQSQALKYTDSAIKIVSHLNDSLMRKEYFQKRFQDSVKWRENFSNDSVQLYKVSRKYADSLNKVTGGLIKNIVQDDGKMNLFGCLVEPYKKLVECQDNFNLQAQLKKRVELQKRSNKKGKK